MSYPERSVERVRHGLVFLVARHPSSANGWAGLCLSWLLDLSHLCCFVNRCCEPCGDIDTWCHGLVCITPPRAHTHRIFLHTPMHAYAHDLVNTCSHSRTQHHIIHVRHHSGNLSTPRSAVFASGASKNFSWSHGRRRSTESSSMETATSSSTRTRARAARALLHGM